MTDTVDLARAHYNAAGLTARIRDALDAIFSHDQRLTIADLAPMDQFHTRGIQATRELAALTPISPETRLLDLGCGVGGPARFLAATFGCPVTGVDLSAPFVEAARYLAERCGMQEAVDFQVGNALDLPFEDGAFDLVFLQHVAMNIENRAALYREITRVLADGGRLATYDVVLKSGELRYPTPWARDASASFLLTQEETRDALTAAGLQPVAWRDDTEAALSWFQALGAGAPTRGPSLAVVLGPEFPALTGNLARNLMEGRVGILSATAGRP